MNTEQFIQCRDVLLRTLKEYQPDSEGEAAALCAAVLNEYLVKARYGAFIRLRPLVSSEDDDKK